MIAKICKIVFAEHYEILLQDIAAALTNRKKAAVKRCSYALDTIVALFAEVTNTSISEANKALYDITFSEKKEDCSTTHLQKNDVERLFCKFYHKQSDLFGTNKDSEAVTAAYEIITMFAELNSLSYDEAARWLSDKRKEVQA